MKNIYGDSKVELIQGDITKAEVDAIVNAANEKLIGGGGVDGAIRRAGGEAVVKACDEIRKKQSGCPTGTAVITTGGNLSAKYVIHTVGPVWQGGNKDEDKLLASCYKECIKIAVENDINSIAFPSISTGVYGYPTELAAFVALQTIRDRVVYCSQKTPAIIQFILFDNATYKCYETALSTI